MTEKKEHRSAMLLRWIAAGEQIECDRTAVIWKSISNESLLRLICQGGEYTDECYRIKPKTIRIGKYDVAEPMKEEPELNTGYYFVVPCSSTHVDYTTWIKHVADFAALESGMAWLKEEDALLAAKAIKELLTDQ